MDKSFTDGKRHYDLGIAYSGMFLWDTAIGEFTMILENPFFGGPAILQLARCYLAQDKFKEAGNLLIELLEDSFRLAQVQTAEVKSLGEELLQRKAAVKK